MSNDNIRSKSVKGTAWSLIDNLTTQGFAFLIGIILARLLSPSDFGTVGVVSIFMLIANVFVDCGFGNAIIAKKERTNEDLSTALYFNLGVGIIVYLILFAISPLVALFFKMPILTSLLRVLGLCVIFNSLSLVQNSILTANLQIRTQTIINLGTYIPAGLIGIWAAYKGFGVWTLVIQQVLQSLLKSVWLWVVGHWKPSLVFSRKSFRYLWGFGWKLLGANLIGTSFSELYSFVIGRWLGAADLGYFSNSKMLAQKPGTLIQNIIYRVSLPIMVDTKGDLEKTKRIYRKMMQMLCFSSFILFTVLIAVANPLILTIWTEKWEKSIFLFQVFCVGFAFAPLSALNFSMLQLMKRTDMTLKLEFIKKPFCLILLLISLYWGLTGIVVSYSLYNVIATFINMSVTRTLLNYNYKEQISDIMVYVYPSVLAVAATLLLLHFMSSSIVALLAGAMLSFGLYILYCAVFKLEAFDEILKITKIEKYVKK